VARHIEIVFRGIVARCGTQRHLLAFTVADRTKWPNVLSIVYLAPQDVEFVLVLVLGAQLFFERVNLVLRVNERVLRLDDVVVDFADAPDDLLALRLSVLEAFAERAE
jgi:hypothetical protein